MERKDREDYSFDICKECGWYEETADYCIKGLFELDEKYGCRYPTEECLYSIGLPKEIYEEIVEIWEKIKIGANNFYDTKKQEEKIEKIQDLFNSLNMYLKDFYEIIEMRTILSEDEQKNYFGKITEISEGILRPFYLYFTDEYITNNLKGIVGDLSPEIIKMRQILKLV